MTRKSLENHFIILIIKAFINVSRTGFEPMTYCLEGSCSIQLSYRDIL